MKPGDLIQRARKARDWSQADLADKVGVSQPAIKKIEAGSTAKSKHLPKIAQVLELDLAALDPSLTRKSEESSQTASADLNQGTPNSMTPRHISAPMDAIPGAELTGERDLPVYSAAQGGRGTLVLSNEAIDWIVRPSPLLRVKDGYGVIIVEDSMAREYNAGDIALVNPHLPPRKGDACVFRSHQDDGSVVAAIKYLRRSTESLWYVEQTNPPKEFTLKRSEWQVCHVAVGKFNGR